MYQLKTTSLSARFYSWIWNTNVSKFKTMCPYFWKYVLTILFLPVILLGKFLICLIPPSKKVAKAVEYIEDSKVGDAVRVVFRPSRFWDIIGNILKWLFIICALIVVLLLIVGMILGFWKNPVKSLAVIGGIVLAIGIIVGIGYTFNEYNIWSKIAYPFKLFGNMVYSLYKNVCPIIKWN